MFSTIALISVFTLASCHYACHDGKPLKNASSENFKICKQYQSNSCCTAERSHQIYEKLRDYLKSTDVTPVCEKMIEDIFCQECSKYSAHLFFGIDNIPHKYPSLCVDHCKQFLEVCDEHASYIFGNKRCNTNINKEPAYCFPKTDLPESSDEQTNQQHPDSDDGDCIPVCLKKIVDGVKLILDVTFPPDGTDRLFLVEMEGFVWEFTKTREKLQKPFLDMSSKVFTDNGFDERGLLSMVFHPQFSTNGLFYIFYNPSNTKDIICRISEMRVSNSSPPMEVDRSYERIILQLKKYNFAHNSGKLLFGIDGYLYVTLGDGALGGDRRGNGQKLTTLWGKILRIDVDDYVEGGRAYGIPEDNPFVEDERALSEIYAYGVRNPWRASVDRKTGEIFLGDVGQERVEEIDIILKGGNYGWRAYEGDECFDQSSCGILPINETVLPIYSYEHDRQNSVTGGFVYRGKQISNLEGMYLFGDYGWRRDARLFLLERFGSKWEKRNVCVGSPDENCPIGSESGMPDQKLIAFGEDEDGELYMSMAKTPRMKVADGAVYKFVNPTA